MHIVLKTLGLELQLVILSLEYALRSPLLFDLFGMLNQQVVLLHLSKITLLADINKLSVKI